MQYHLKYFIESVPLTIAPLVANSTKIIFTIVTESKLNKQNISINLVFGILFIIFGICLCM